MRNIGFATTIAALCLGAGLLAGTASAAEDAKPKKDRTDYRGIYGGIGFGPGFFDEENDVEDAWRLQVWYRAFDYLSFEMGYIDAGDPDGQVEDVDGLHLVGVPTLPLFESNFDVFAKVGGFFNEDNEVAVGLGASYHLPYNFGLRVDWDRLDVDDHEGIDVLTVSLFYHLARYKKK